MDMRRRAFSDQRADEARLGYQAAVSLWISENQHNWSRFNIVMVANSLLLTIEGILLGSQGHSDTLAVGLPCVGLGLCFVWYLQSVRGFAYMHYFLKSAREYEERHFGPALNLIARGGSYVDGNPVRVGGAPMQLDVFGRPPIRRTAHAMILLFVVSYLLVLVVAVPDRSRGAMVCGVYLMAVVVRLAIWCSFADRGDDLARRPTSGRDVLLWAVPAALAVSLCSAAGDMRASPGGILT